MRKFRIYLDKDKETAWLNEMSAQGWAAKGFLQGFTSSRRVRRASMSTRLILAPNCLQPVRIIGNLCGKRELSLSRHGGIGLFCARKPRREILSCIQMSPRGLAHYKNPQNVQGGDNF